MSRLYSKSFIMSSSYLLFALMVVSFVYFIVFVVFILLHKAKAVLGAILSFAFIRIRSVEVVT